MTNYHECELKDDPFLWAIEEFQRDPGYWQEKAKNGKGLFREIAEFVIKSGRSQEKGESHYFHGEAIRSSHRE